MQVNRLPVHSTTVLSVSTTFPYYYYYYYYY